MIIEKKEEHKSLWAFSVQNKDDKENQTQPKKKEKVQEKKIIEIGKIDNIIISDKPEPKKETEENKSIITSKFSPLQNLKGQSIKKEPKKETIAEKNNKSEKIKKEIIRDEDKNKTEQRKINEGKMKVENIYFSKTDSKSKSLEKKDFNKYKEEQNEKDKKPNNRFISSKSYKNIEEPENKIEKKEVQKRTWKFNVQNKDAKDNIEISIPEKRTEEKYEKRLIEQKEVKNQEITQIQNKYLMNINTFKKEDNKPIEKIISKKEIVKIPEKEKEDIANKNKIKQFSYHIKKWRMKIKMKKKKNTEVYGDLNLTTKKNQRKKRNLINM